MPFIIQWLLGPFGRSVADFLRENPLIWTILLGSWFAFYLTGHWQLNRIRRRTEALTLERARKILASKPNVTASGIYQRVLPTWREEVIKWAWFIPHRLEMWPVRVTPENVIAKLGFTPGWVSALLRKNGVLLHDAPQARSKDSRDAADHGKDN